MSRSKQLTIDINGDGPQAVGFDVQVCPSAANYYGEKYLHAEIHLMVRREYTYSGKSHVTWKRFAVLTAQAHKLDDGEKADGYWHGEHHLQAVRQRETDGVKFSKWYALKLESVGTGDNVTESLDTAVKLLPIWKRVDKLVGDEKNLQCKYRDGLTPYIAALNILGAQALKMTDDYEVYEEDWSLGYLR
jgi:hypothetical protein